MKNIKDYFHTKGSADIIDNFINFGLYVTVYDDGSIKRNLITETGDRELPPTTIKDEIIEYSEMNFKYFSVVINNFKALADSIKQDDEEAPPTEENKKLFKKFSDTFDELIKCLIEEDNLIPAVLIRLSAQDMLPIDDGSYAYIKIFTEIILDILSSIVELNLLINDAFYSIHTKTAIDEEGKNYFLSQAIFRQELTFANGLTSRYLFRSVNEYYIFLLMHFLDKRPNITRCSCCGRYFVPKTKKVTKYCDRIVKDGKTCKQVAPILKHKREAQNDEVIAEFDRMQHNIYQNSSMHLCYEEYWAWSTAATEARDKYLKGELSKAAALKIIRKE